VTFGARPGKPYLYAFGYGAEIALSYTIAVGRRLGLAVSLDGRLLLVPPVRISVMFGRPIHPGRLQVCALVAPCRPGASSAETWPLF